MIQKEQIQLRRQEIAEIRHADSVYRDIVARENEREDYEKRWFWELLQNAKDSIEDDEKIQVKIEISEDEISFSHSGNAFELDDILSLIIQGSSKNRKSGKTGRFGTGFMTTYLLSKEVEISGKLTDNQGCFHFLLNRNASNNDDFFKLQQESNEAFSNSIREDSYLGTSPFQTKFTYKLDDKGKFTSEIGLKCLDELIPITQLFNEQIESVTVIESSNTKTFTKSFITQHQTEGSIISEWEVYTVLNGSKDRNLKAYISQNKAYEACIITHYANGIETVFPLTNNYPRLYFTFPLIGTEEIGVPIIINSTKFDPRIERDGVYLKKITETANEFQNKEIIEQALKDCSISFSNLFSSKEIDGIFELFNYKLAKELKWIDQEWLNQVKNEVINKLSSKSVIRFSGGEKWFTSLNNLTVPYSTSKENIRGLWDLLSLIRDFKVPLIAELEQWITIAENIAKLRGLETDVFKLDFVWGVGSLIQYIEEKGTLEVIEKIIDSGAENWLNDFYSLIIRSSNGFPLDKRILLNQDRELRKGEGMYWDKFANDDLISISKLTELNFAGKLISRNITSFPITGINDFTKQDAINELKSFVNDLSEFDFSDLNLLKCNALFLKWLIAQNQKEIIRDLKVLTGANKKNEENYNFDHFPKAEHLLLSPKPFFESLFPMYSNLVRDKDCLNEGYNEYLGEEDYKYLDENGFIHYNPIVIRNENANLKILELLAVNESDLSPIRDGEGQLLHKVRITYSDFAYLTATDGHIYGRNTTQKSSLDRFKFLLKEAVEKDTFFENDLQEVRIEGIEKPLFFRKCLWVYRAKRLTWVNIKAESENAETKFISETPSSKNLSELLRGDDSLIKDIRGSKQQLLLNKLGVGVSDLIRNTLPSDALRLSWDKAITNMITSDADPELVQEIFNDPNIKKEYEQRLQVRKLIVRNQKIGKLIEDLFREYIDKLKEQGYPINIERRPFGSDYVITEESSDFINGDNQREGFKINDWLIELKATGKDHAAMTPLQAKTATECKDHYALVVVPLDGSNPDIEYVRTNAKVIQTIGYKIEKVIPDFNEVELKKSSLNNGKEGISVNIEDQNVRFHVDSQVWLSEEKDIEKYIATNFAINTTVNKDTVNAN